jgi:hypothetical protein
MGFSLNIERLPLRSISRRSIAYASLTLTVMVLYLYLFPSNNLNHRYGGKLSSNIRSFNSVCSPDADRRGAHQKVISYSLYGNYSKPGFAGKYLKFFRQTLSKIPVAYPGK